MRRIPFALIGGGPGALIGPVHRMAAELDRRFELVAGSFSRDTGRNAQAGTEYGVAADRTYASVDALLSQEAKRTDRALLIAIATPNDSHLAIARAALEAGLHVMSDKPATATLEEALELQQIVRRSDGHYALSFTYSGYAMIRAARRLVADGAIGAVRKVNVTYLQGWLGEPLEPGSNRQADWRTDPARVGRGGAISDIGSHAFHLAEFVSGSRIVRLCADLAAVVPGRRLDDDGMLLCGFEQGARGTIHVSQVATGARNNLVLELFGDNGGLRWEHERAAELRLFKRDGSEHILHEGSQRFIRPHRLPAGHPQGFVEAFANLYADMADAISHGTRAVELPTIKDGLRAMRVADAAIRSSAGRQWVEVAQ